VKIRDLKPGQRARIRDYGRADRDYLRQLLRMGLLRGTEIQLVRAAPLGDPIELAVRGYKLTLRKDEANILEVDILDGC